MRLALGFASIADMCFVGKAGKKSPISASPISTG